MLASNRIYTNSGGPPRTARTQRRAEERKRVKDARKLQTQGITTTSTSTSIEPNPSEAAKPAASPAQRSANQQNALHSTGPRTPQGKAASSKNSTRHGLASCTFTVLAHESQESYAQLEAQFDQEYQPASITELLLVQKMVQSWWLRQRAQECQDTCISQSRLDPKEMAVYMRYQAQHDRNFHKALHDLRQLRADHQRELQNYQRSENQAIVIARQDEIHQLRTELLRIKISKSRPAPTSNVAVAPEIGFVPQLAADCLNLPINPVDTSILEAAA